MAEAQTMLSPAEAMLSTASRFAACPEEVSIAPTPPSSAAILFSTISTVGLEMRVYMWPGTDRSKSLPRCSAESYL